MTYTFLFIHFKQFCLVPIIFPLSRRLHLRCIMCKTIEIGCSNVYNMSPSRVVSNWMVNLPQPWIMTQIWQKCLSSVNCLLAAWDCRPQSGWGRPAPGLHMDKLLLYVWYVFEIFLNLIIMYLNRWVYVFNECFANKWWTLTEKLRGKANNNEWIDIPNWTLRQVQYNKVQYITVHTLATIWPSGPCQSYGEHTRQNYQSAPDAIMLKNT